MKITYMVQRIWSLCAPFHWYLIRSLGLLFAHQATTVVLPLILGYMVTALTDHDIRSFMWVIGAWIVIACVRPLISYMRERLGVSDIDFDISQHLSRISMDKFFEISMGQHRIDHSVIKQSVVSKGEAGVSGIVFSCVYELVPTSLAVVLPLGFLFAKAPYVGLLALASIVGFLVYTVKYNASFVPRLCNLNDSANLASKRRYEVIENAEVVMVNAQEGRVRDECDGENIKCGNMSKPFWHSYILWLYGGQLFITIAHVACCAMAGYQTYTGSISCGVFVSIYIWVGSALGTLTNISNIQRNLTKNVAPVIDYFRFLDYQSNIVMPEHPVPLGDFKGRIEFRNVDFAYPARDEKDTTSRHAALKKVSFVLEAGKRHAFVGKSGAGKSTIIGLLLRAFDPQGGQVLVDGVDIRKRNYHELRRNIGVVPQDVALFDGTMRYNITFGLNGNAAAITDAKLAEVVEQSRISEFFGKLEKGLETIIGERGFKLSGGQRQRVGIARALIKDPKVLIFDEATSSLDTENEAQIRKSIHDASVGKTTVIIAHRLATVMDADKIFVFDGGEIVGQGTHAELLGTNEYYKRLVQNQVIMS